LDMVQKIGAMVLERVPDPRHHPPLLIDPPFLASETPEILHPTPMLPSSSREGSSPGDEVQKMQYCNSQGVPLSTVSFDHDEQQQLPSPISSGRGADRKRGRAISMHSDETPPIPHDAFPHDPTTTTAATTPAAAHSIPMEPWDLSYLIASDDDPHMAIEFIEDITPLARRLESMPGLKRSLPSYQRLRCDVWHRSRFIFGNDPRHGGLAAEKRRSHLDGMYGGTLEKMDALVAMTERMEEEAAGLLHRRAVSEMRGAAGHSGGRPSSSLADPKPPSARKEFSKKKFTEYMNRWLKHNWTNPYPDDEGLANIALVCGTNNTVVSNWLINARTRKWRPAIIRAYENKRPAEYLLEDSILILEGNELREIVSGVTMV